MSDKDPYRYFRIEARELLDEMSSAVLSLEKAPSAGKIIARLLRLAHTLKGAARVVGQKGIADHAHAIEDALTPWRDTDAALPAEASQPLLSRLDEMEAMLGELGAPAQIATQATPSAGPVATSALPEPVPTSSAPRRVARPNSSPSPAPSAKSFAPPSNGLRGAEDTWRSLRADPEDLGALLNGIGGSHMQVASMRRHLEAAVRAGELADQLLGHLAKRRHKKDGAAGTPGIELDVAVAHDMAEELRAHLGQLDAALSRTTDQLDRELRQTRDIAEQLKLVPARQLFNSLARTVRDVAQAQGKQASFQGEGGGVRLDAEVLAALQPGLVQMIRNAVAHGIEAPAQRLAAGKPEEGSVVVRVIRQGRHVRFVCEDDGAGVDSEAVVQSARQQGLLDAEAPVDDATLTRLLLRGGVSTAAVVSEVSGRGIGLNVVSDAMERLGGEVRLETAKGQGTRWHITVPLVMASIAVLGIEAAGVHASVPLDAVRHALRVPASELSVNSEGRTLIHDGLAIPFAPLAQALQRSGEADNRAMWSTVVVEGEDGLAAIGVDRLLGVGQIVMLPLPPLTPADDVVAGATLDVEGHPQIVLDPHHLVLNIRGARQLPDKTAPRAPLLVIDDSLTTRMLEQSILVSAGYEVHTATSAEEGLDMARKQAYALMLVDVDMPGMDGFTFVQTIRQDEALKHVPAILVTSRSAPEDRQRGQEVGADHYIVKGEFAQGAFLDTVRRLVDRSSDPRAMPRST